MVEVSGPFAPWASGFFNHPQGLIYRWFIDQLFTCELLFTDDPLITQEKPYSFIYRWSVDHPRKSIWFYLPLIRWSPKKIHIVLFTVDPLIIKEKSDSFFYRWSVDQNMVFFAKSTVDPLIKSDSFFSETYRWSVDQIRCFRFRKLYHNWNPAQGWFTWITM